MFVCLFYCFQDTPYNFEEVPPLQDSLMNFTFLDDDTLYEVSLKHEPRYKKYTLSL